MRACVCVCSWGGRRGGEREMQGADGRGLCRLGRISLVLWGSVLFVSCNLILAVLPASVVCTPCACPMMPCPLFFAATALDRTANRIRSPR